MPAGVVVERDAPAVSEVDVLERVARRLGVQGEQVGAVAGLDAVAVAVGLRSFRAVGVAQRGKRSNGRLGWSVLVGV